jgi:hypothetical protein
MFCFRLLQFASHKLFFNTIVYVGFLIYICSHMKTLEQIVELIHQIEFDMDQVDTLITKHLRSAGKADIVSDAYFDSLVEAKAVLEGKVEILKWVIEL